MSISQRDVDNELIRRLIYALERNTQAIGGVDEVQRAFLASVVPMFPHSSVVYTVTAAPAVFLIRNDSLSLMPIRIRNEDPAVFLYIGQRDIVIPGGERIDPGETRTFVLRRGQDVWGVSALGPIQVIVSQLESAYTAAVSDGPITL